MNAMLPAADCAFSIPSVHDNLELDGRLYFPRPTDRSQPLAKAIAIVAHPYAPLGGCMDDHVVQAVAVKLLKSGYIVNTFNFRGASGSTGRTSWTGNSELADYVSFVIHLLHFIRTPGLRVHVQSNVLILGGYSYGSLIASCLPDLQSLQQYIHRHRADYSIKEIATRADRLSKVFLGFVEAHGSQDRTTLHPETPPGSPRGVRLGGYNNQTASRRISRDSLRQSFDTGAVRRSMEKVKRRISASNDSNQDELHDHNDDELPLGPLPTTAILLVSPILPPVASFITMFSKPSFDTEDQTKPFRSQQQKNLSRNSSLVIFGSEDIFTSAHKLKRWVEEISTLPDSALSYREIVGAGHFWREAGVEEALQNEISAWSNSIIKE